MFFHEGKKEKRKKIRLKGNGYKGERMIFLGNVEVKESGAGLGDVHKNCIEDLEPLFK